jgi:membrane-anchored glycerophosphoryl diester phosphodiesterase (GDPDase)
MFVLAIAAFGTTVCKIVADTPIEKRVPTLLAFDCLVNALFPTLFADQWRFNKVHGIPMFFYIFIEIPLVDLVFSPTIRVVALDPHQLAAFKTRDAGTASP